jgi:hypothetical protein
MHTFNFTFLAAVLSYVAVIGATPLGARDVYVVQQQHVLVKGSDQTEKNLPPARTAFRTLTTRTAWPANRILSRQPTARRSVLKIVLMSRSARSSAIIIPSTLSAPIRRRRLRQRLQRRVRPKVRPKVRTRLCVDFN